MNCQMCTVLILSDCMQLVIPRVNVHIRSGLPIEFQVRCCRFFAGTMPVEPANCYLGNSVAVMHIHGKFDLIIDYDEDWDWKDGEHEELEP